MWGLQYIDEMEMAKTKIEKFRYNNAGENNKFTENLSELQKNILHLGCCNKMAKLKKHLQHDMDE